MERSDQLAIATAPPDRAREALLLVLADLSPDDRAATAEVILTETRRGRLSLVGLLEARRRRELVGAVFSQVETGRTAVLWPPRLIPGEPRATAEALLGATTHWLAEESVAAAHALLPTVTVEDDTVLRGAGFEPLAELLYLVSLEEQFPVSEPPSLLQFEPYTPGDHDRLARVVEATYDGSLDCRGMENVRRIEDVLASYRATGEFSPERWLVVRHAGRDVGCLLLADHPERQNLELVYMGLAKYARGGGWGAQLARHAQWVARTIGRQRLVLAVDAANGPALRAYAAVGFEAWERRQVYLMRFGSPS